MKNKLLLFLYCTVASFASAYAMDPQKMLNDAIDAGNVEQVIQAIEDHGADVNFSQDALNLDAPLIRALAHPNIVKIMVEQYGADVTLGDPLHTAISRAGLNENLREQYQLSAILLMPHIDNVNESETEFGWTPMMIAIDEELPAVVQSLLQNPIAWDEDKPWNVKDKAGRSARDRAIETDNQEIQQIIRSYIDL